MKIAVLVSGGVDSSVALNLLKKEGHDITAFYLKIWLQDEFTFLGDCPWEDDLNFVRGAACRRDGRIRGRVRGRSRASACRPGILRPKPWRLARAASVFAR